MFLLSNFSSYKSLRKSTEISFENLCVGNFGNQFEELVCEYCGVKVKPKNKLIFIVKSCESMIILFVLILIG